MKLVIHPRVSDEWLRHIHAVSPALRVVDCESEADAEREVGAADAFYGAPSRRGCCGPRGSSAGFRRRSPASSGTCFPLDVLEVEPLPADHPLWTMPNVVITPHVAANAPGVTERWLEVLLDNLGRFVRDEPLRNVVDKNRWC